MFRSGNPTLSDRVFDAEILASRSAAPDYVMTVQGAVTKTLFVLAIAAVCAGYVWKGFFANEDVFPYMIAGGIGGSLLGFVTAFWRRAAPFTTPVYAALEGLFLGGLSAQFEQRYPGLVIQAVGITFGTLAALLLAYKVGLIRATERFRTGIFAATGAIALVYLVDMVLWFFGTRVPFIHDSGPLGIAISVAIAAIAALNLVLDFDFIERGAAHGAPKYMEWYGAFGLLVTLVWLYLEVLRLLAKLQGGRGSSSSRRVSS
jgi:uncharacterized YccA/Bax inhibitor family protein